MARGAIDDFFCSNVKSTNYIVIRDKSTY